MLKYSEPYEYFSGQNNYLDGNINIQNAAY